MKDLKEGVSGYSLRVLAMSEMDRRTRLRRATVLERVEKTSCFAVSERKLGSLFSERPCVDGCGKPRSVEGNRGAVVLLAGGKGKGGKRWEGPWCWV